MTWRKRLGWSFEARSLASLGEASPWSAEGLGRGHAKSTALKAASSEANSDPPYKEAYWYGRDTENRLANQLATGIAAV